MSLGALALLSACASQPGYTARRGVTYIVVDPPAPRREVILVQPGPSYVWVGGYWAWQGRNYAWVPGRWSPPPRGYRSWSPGHWRRHRHGWYWIDGRWR